MWVPVTAPWASWGPLAISLACPHPYAMALGMFPRDNAHTPRPSCLQPLPSFPLVTSRVHSPFDPTWGVCVSVCVCSQPCVYLCPQEEAQGKGPHMGVWAGVPQDLRGSHSQRKPHGKLKPWPRKPEPSLFLQPLLTWWVPGQSLPLLPSVGQLSHEGLEELH